MVKYQIPYKDQANVSWRIDISLAAYSGYPIVLRGVSPTVCDISWQPVTTDDPFAWSIPSTAAIRVYNQSNIDVPELQKAQDKDFVVQIYRSSVLFWQGYLIPDGIQKPMKSVPEISFNCTDGLSLLADMPYSHNNLPGLTSMPTRCPMNYIRQILFSTNNLGIPLPIKWTNGLLCTVFASDPDMMTGQVVWSARGEGFASAQTPTPTVPGTGYVYKKCEYILAGMLKSWQCRIFQDGGAWVIRRINDITTGSFNSNSIAGDLGIMTVTTSAININKVIGATGYKFINEDQLTTTKPGVKYCKVTYDANVRENILPNGNQDFVNTFFNVPFYWGLISGTDATYTSVGAIDGRAGAATDLANPGGGGGAADAFTMVNDSIVETYLPVDGYTLVKRLNFGFIFSPVNGFPFNPANGIINWSTTPFRIKIIYVNGATILYLDEFAIWRDTDTTIPIIVEGTAINDIIQVDFNKGNAIILPQPAHQPVPGTDTCQILVSFLLPDGMRYTLDYVHIGIDSNNDIYESQYDSVNTIVDERTLEISSGWGGYILSNYMTNWDTSDSECYYTDGIYTGTLTGLTANAIMRFMYKASDIYNGSMHIGSALWSFDELYTIDSLSGKYLPLNATYSTETCIVNLVAIECRNDTISLTEKHYGSNDNQLSN